MNVKIQEDCRTLGEFYPDPEVRRRVHYEFAHRFLPQYVHQNPYAFFSYLYRSDVTGGTLEPTRFIQSRWDGFEKMLGLVEREAEPLRNGIVFRRVVDLTMSTQEVAGRPVALVQMPAPEQGVNAFFVAVALLASPDPPENWPRDVQARVFTLEAECSDDPGVGKTGLLCEWTREGKHRNFGVRIPAEKDAFQRAVAVALETPNAPPMASWSPPTGEVSLMAPGGGPGGPPRRGLGLSRRMLWGAGLCLLLIAWIGWLTRASWLAEANPWILMLVGGAASFVVWAAVFGSQRESVIAKGPLPWLTAAVVVLGFGVVLGIWRWFPGSRLFVENYSQQAVTLMLDGRKWVSAPTNSSRQVVIARRPHAVSVVNLATGQTLDQQAIAPWDRGPYVFNVLGAQTYYSGTVSYSTGLGFPGRSPDSAPEETVIRDPWFHARANYLFEHPSSSLEVRQSENQRMPRNLSRTYLLRYSYRDHPVMSPEMEETFQRMEAWRTNLNRRR